MIVLDILSWVLLVGGAVFSVIGGVGLLRLPNVYARAHAAGINDTLGAGMILLGLMLQGGLTLVTVKLAMILVFLLLIGPITGHALLKAAHARGVSFKEPEEDSDAR